MMSYYKLGREEEVHQLKIRLKEFSNVTTVLERFGSSFTHVFMLPQ